MNLINKKIEELKPYKNNAKLHPESQIKKIENSIREFGFKQPLIIDKNNEVIAGHGRLIAAKNLGFTELPCVLADDLSINQIKAFRIMDNKSAESDWDFEVLKEELNFLSNDDFNLDFTGFDVIEVNKYLKGIDNLKEEKFNNNFEVIITCKDEIEQKKVYEKLQKEGYDCRVLLF